MVSRTNLKTLNPNPQTLNPALMIRIQSISPSLLYPEGTRMLAGAWELAGERDSVAKYVALADSGLQWSVNIGQFQVVEEITILGGSISNIANRPLPVMTLEFEFLDAQGQALYSHAETVPALEAGGRHALSLRIEQGGAAAWRYRKR